MKRIYLRFENNIGKILTVAIIAIVMGLVASVAFFDNIIVVGCIFAFLCAGSFAALMCYVLRKEVIIDFKNNLLKMKTGTKKEQCELDKVKKMEIVFRWVNKMKCYSAQVFAYLKDGKTISIKIYPKSYKYRISYYYTGRVTEKFKSRIERQVSGYDFITCHTKNQ